LSSMVVTSDHEAELLKSALENVVSTGAPAGENVAATILQTAMANHGK
jgi:lambda repressor-like predicted transcriptional regulator